MDASPRLGFEAAHTQRHAVAGAKERADAERRWEALWRTVPAAVVVHAADTSLLDANPAACVLLGQSLEEMLGRLAHHPMWRFVEADGSRMPVERFPVHQLANGQPLQGFLLGILGGQETAIRWVICDGFVLKNADGTLGEVVVTFVDLTPLMLSQQALALSDDRLAIAARLARLGVWSLQLPFKSSSPVVLSWEARALIGDAMADSMTHVVTLADLLGRISTSERRALRRAAVNSLRNIAAIDVEVTMTDGGGRTRNLRVFAQWRRQSTGVVGLEGAVQDVSNWRQAQERLLLLEAAVSRLSDMVLITEADPLDEPGPRIVFVNPAFERLTGYTSEEAAGRSPRMLQGLLTDRQELRRIRSAIEQRRPVRAELLNYAKDGRQYWVELDIVPLINERGSVHHLVSVQRDITARRELEAERLLLERRLYDAQRMESIGTLAGGIAHDFNNILPAILGNAELALDTLPAEHPAHSSLKQIKKAALRGRALVQQILTFSRPGSRAFRPLPVALIVEETLMLLRASLPVSVRLEVVLPPEPVIVEADPTQLHQVLMNLCTNSWHALNGRPGMIQVGLDTVSVSEFGDSQAVSGPWAHVWVRDDGCGMDAATRDRMFEPFFTTKPAGMGTGLGLSVVQGIVQNHGGRLDVQSTPGVGSTFHVHLRLAPADRISPSETLPCPAGRRGQGERVMYVDDDEVMALLVKQLLEREGFAVQTFLSGSTALSWVADHGTTIRLVVTDYNMPDMTGTDLARRLRGILPHLPMIITSGNVTDDVRSQAATIGLCKVLEKQLILEQLQSLVSTALEAPV